jgi:hypothetical protein
MEHDKNAVISDANGTMGHNEGTVDADPKEIMPNPYILAHNSALFNSNNDLQKLKEVPKNCEFFLDLPSHA